MIFRLPSLSVLTLSDCGLQSLLSSLKNQHANFTSLSVLDLSGNDFHSTIPHWMFNISSLTYLDLSVNNFNGQIPSAFENLISLEVLLLFGNRFDGLIFPRGIKNLCRLHTLDLSYNRFGGEFMAMLGGSSSCIKDSLQILSLQSNNLKENLPDILEQFRYLRTLDLRYNMISGSIPASIGRLSFLSKLYLSGNQLNGTVPNIIGQLSDLKVLDLAHNSLQGIISEHHFTNLMKLEELDMSSNSLVLNVTPGWVPPFHLKVIGLGSCHLGGYFPKWLHTQSNFIALNLSNTRISDTIPDWLWNLSSQVVLLDLSQNEIRGMLPMSFSSTNIVDINLSYNKFEGSLPRLPSRNNEVSLNHLILSNNKINGSIPSSICKLEELAVLDISNNQLSGELPTCWKNLTSLMAVNLANNNLSIGVMQSMMTLDLSRNELSGEIPVGVLSLLGLQGLNLSRNHLTGNIPSKIGVIRSMMTLDLSRNELSGQIPPSLSNLSFLNHLNLSFNNLSGGNQLQTLNDTSIYIGNSDLCGPPLPQECPGDGPSQSPSFTSKENEDEGGDIQEMLWFYLGIVSGFILGCWMVWGVLFLKRSWRIAYFLLMDDLYDKVYVTSVLSVRRLKAMKARI
ncbi:hypothetical protein QJS04_geneDACA001979 [Acorus gramineus]|uniref:Uncharacterized protein n=1 Tax=Acorus gramineus TaxID=55184 RepID=A0AAV9A8J8_ACOGR|nr:hypothetical protein QJS04_geneDACA001979 [Acorus gramineus]